MNDSPNSRAGRIPSDEQMDGLLRDFFAAETPAALRQPFHQLAAAGEPNTPLVKEQWPAVASARLPRSRRIIVVACVSTLALSLLVAVQTKSRQPAQNGLLQNSEIATSPQQSAASAMPVESLMLVSPNGNTKSAAHPVGEDGVTLEETDSIELKPLR